MKKLLLLISILAMLALPVVAQEPGPVYLPIVIKGNSDMPFQILEISDGSTTVNLLSEKSGFYLTDWEPALADPKGGGVWKDSALAEGRRLGMRQRANAVDTLTLAVRDWTPDDLIRDTQNLRRLLEKACAYDTTSWQDEPVWVKRHPVGATNAEYTVIKDYRTPQDGNPHGSDTFWTNLARAGFHEFVLVLEHEGFWRADPPGTGTCVQAAGQQEWEYGAWTVNTALPVSVVAEMLELPTGRILAADNGGGGEVWHTDDGGATAWVASTTPPAHGPYSFVNASDGYIYAACWSGVQYAVYRSGDNGLNWAVRNNANGSRYHHSITEHTDGYLYLAEWNSGGEIKRSNDGGATWNAVLTGLQLAHILSASDGYLYAAGGGWHGETVVVRSQDGTTWDTVFNYQQAGWSNDILCLRELNDGCLYAGGDGGIVAHAQLYRSCNGTDWALIYDNPGIASQIMDVFYATDGYYYMVVGNGEVYRTVDPSLWILVVDVGTGQCSLLEYTGNSRIYVGQTGDIWWSSPSATFGRAATCTDEVYVANKQNVANLTHVKTYDASGVPPDDYLDRFPWVAAFPYQLLPAALANTDAVYFGIQSATFDSGPFDNIVLDLIPATGDFDITWEYSDGVAGWPTLNVQDGTYTFSQQGVCSVHWVPPSDWAVEAVDGATAYWVRAVVSNVAGAPTGPLQDNRDPYTVTWPRVDVDEEQVGGDIPALMRFNFRNRSDEDGYASVIDELDLLENRVIVGLRSMDRGGNFAAYLNCSDEQNPPGVIASDGAATADSNDIDHPTGRSMTHTTTGLSTWTDECTFTLAPVVARDFYGSFHAYFRGWQQNWTSGVDEVRVRLQVRTGSGGVTFTTEHKPFRNLDDWQLLDFGSVDIPASGLLSSSDLGDETELVIQIWSSVASKTVELYDLILIPTDEWALDAVDKALEDDSGVTNGYYLDVDSVYYPKRDIRVMARQAGSGYIRSIYQPNTPGPAILQANADQRLWFLTARGCISGIHTGGNNQTTLTAALASFLTSGVEPGQTIFNVTDGSSGFVGATVTVTTISDCGLAGGTDNDWDTNDEYLILCPNWRSEPWNAHSVRVWGNARYLSMRGAR